MGNGILIKNNDIRVYEETFTNVTVNANSYTEINTLMPKDWDGRKLVSTVFITGSDALSFSISTANYSGYKVTVCNQAPVVQSGLTITVKGLYM